MTFDEICAQSGLPPEAIRFYVESKLLAPLYPRRNVPEEGEYAEEDIQLLHAIANMRRLDFSIDSIRHLLLDHTQGPALVVERRAALRQLLDITKERLVQLNQLHMGTFNGPDDVQTYFSALTVNSPLPRRDIYQDEGQKVRNDVAERRREISELFARLNQSEERRRRSRRWLIVLGIVLLVALGWIIAPLWIAYLPKV